MDDHALYQIIARNDIENIRAVAFAIAVMQKRYTSTFVVQGETLGSRMEKIYRQACQWRLWWLIRYCASHLRKTITSLAPAITSLLVHGKQVDAVDTHDHKCVSGDPRDEVLHGGDCERSVHSGRAVQCDLRELP